MDEAGVGPGWAIFGVIVAAAIAALATAMAARWATRNERVRLRQELISITGGERERLATELDRVRTRANEVDEELEKVRDERRLIADEYAAAKIAHREAIADKDAAARESLAAARQAQYEVLASKEAQERALGLQLQQMQNQMEACDREMTAVRAELERRTNMIQAQSQIIADFQARNRDRDQG